MSHLKRVDDHEPQDTRQTRESVRGASEFPPYKVTVYSKGHPVYDKHLEKYVAVFFKEELSEHKNKSLKFTAEQKEPGFFTKIFFQFRRLFSNLKVKVEPMLVKSEESKTSQGKVKNARQESTSLGPEINSRLNIEKKVLEETRSKIEQSSKKKK